MSTLHLQVGRDVDRGVGDDERLVVVRDVHDEAMADAPRGPKAGVALDHRAHQFVGVEAALHQRLGAALAHQRDRLCGRVLAVLGIDDLESADVEAVLRGDVADPLLRPDQDRLDQFQLRRFDRAFQRHLIARMRDRDLYRRILLRPRDQLVELLVRVSADGGLRLKHRHRLLLASPEERRDQSVKRPCSRAALLKRRAPRD